MTDTDTTTPKTRTIVLTDRAPVQIIEADWPVIAWSGEDSWRGIRDPALHNQAAERDELTVWSLHVRRHEDGRTLVYGVLSPSCSGDGEAWRGGELLDADADLPAAIRRVGESCETMPDSVIRECIADLPAERI